MEIDRNARHEPFVADVGDEEAVARAVADVLGRGPVPLLFSVAGIGSTQSAPDTSLETWERVFAVNVRGASWMCKHVIRP